MKIIDSKDIEDIDIDIDIGYVQNVQYMKLGSSINKELKSFQTDPDLHIN